MKKNYKMTYSCVKTISNNKQIQYNETVFFIGFCVKISSYIYMNGCLLFKLVCTLHALALTCLHLCT